jgi:hypothetical protein
MGSTVPDAHPCGEGFYCAGGDGAPRVIEPGFEGTGAAPGWAAAVTRTGFRACVAGSTCARGVASQCPGGTFGDAPRESRTQCAGDCAAGHFCPPGSTNPTAYRCGDVYLPLVDVLSSVPAAAALAAAPADADSLPLAAGLDGPGAASLLALYSGLRAALGAGGAAGGAAWPAALALPAMSVLSGAEWRDLVAAAAGGGAGADSAAGAAAGLWLDYRERLLSLTALLSPGAAAGAAAVLAAAAAADGARGGAPPPRAPKGVLAVATTGGGWLNVTATIPWGAGVRLRLPAPAVPVDSFAASYRAVLGGGPSGVFCPPGSAWPTAAPLGFFTTTSPAAAAAAADAAARAAAAAAALGGAALADAAARAAPFFSATTLAPAGAADVAAALAAEAAAAVAANLTRDGAAAASPGWYAASGVAHPCAPGTYNAAPGGFARRCATCPAGHACALGAALPAACADGEYAPAGSPTCATCPGAPGGVVLPVSAAEAAAQAPVVAVDGAAPGRMGLASDPAVAASACKTSRACCL